LGENGTTLNKLDCCFLVAKIVQSLRVTNCVLSLDILSLNEI